MPVGSDASKKTEDVRTKQTPSSSSNGSKSSKPGVFSLFKRETPLRTGTLVMTWSIMLFSVSVTISILYLILTQANLNLNSNLFHTVRIADHEALKTVHAAFEAERSRVGSVVTPVELADALANNATLADLRRDLDLQISLDKYDGILKTGYPDTVSTVNESAPASDPSGDTYYMRPGFLRRSVNPAFIAAVKQTIWDDPELTESSDTWSDEVDTPDVQATFVPEGGFVPYQHHEATGKSWYVVMTHVYGNGSSYLPYMHPTDGRYQRVYESNDSIQLMEVRKTGVWDLWSGVVVQRSASRFSIVFRVPRKFADILRNLPNTFSQNS